MRPNINPDEELLSSIKEIDSEQPVKKINSRDENLLSSIRELGQDQISQMKANVYASTPIPPDSAAKQYDTFKQTNIPVGIVRTQENEIKQMTELDSINYDDLINNFPKTALQLADSNKAGAIRDDISNLSYFEKVIGSVKQEYKAADENVDLADLQIKRMLFDVSGNEKFKLSPLEENNLALINESQAQRKDYKLGFLSSIPANTASAIPTILNTIPQTLAGTALGAGVGFAIGGPVGATLGANRGSKVGTAYGAGKLETGLAYQELRDLVDENGKPIEKQVAAGGAIATGVVNGLLELVPFAEGKSQIKKAFLREGVKQLAKTSIGREYLKNIGKLALAEGITEGFQELSNVVFAESAKAISNGDFKLLGMKDANDSEGLLKFISDNASRIAESAKAGFGGGLGLGVATGGISAAEQAFSKKENGEKNQGIISDIVEKTKESKVFKRSQELFKDTTENTLGEQNVYLPAEDVLTFFQTKSPEELEQFYKIVPEAREQIQSALETGGDIVLKGNNAFTAFANEAFSGLQSFAKLSPETLNEKEAQDTFLNDVVSNVNRDGEVRQQSTENEKVRSNIKNQILGLRLPKDETQNLITTLTSYYDTKSARYGSAEAQKILDTYLGNLEVKNGVRNIKSIDDLDAFINKARSNKPIKKTKPLLKFLKEKGGVRLDSNLAGELKHIGLNPKTAPGLFRKEGGIGDVDNIPLSEFKERFPNVETNVGEDYVDRQAILNLIGKEVAGEDISQVKTEDQEKMERFVEDLDRLGIELKNASNEDIKKAIDSFKDDENTFFQIPTGDTLAFYSALEKSISDIPQGKGSPEQWTGIIKNLTQKGIKQEEIEWSGIQDWLKEQKGSVTKEQIIDYLKANQIEIEEILKGENEAEKLEKEYEYAASVVNKGISKKLPEKKLQKLRDIRDDLRDRWMAIRDKKQNTKFEKYTLAGGENYRELLLTLPQDNIEHQSFREMVKESYGKEPEELSERLLAAAKSNYEKNSDFKNFKNAYKSSHFEEPNVLAHIRFNERTDKDGKRVMFIEELQSDWHQEGRKKGYKPSGKQKNKINARIDEILKLADEAGGITNLSSELQKEGKELGLNLVKEGAPDAPFKTTWPELAFKRALMWAVENNFDKVAWTTGEQQAERYDLSKQIKSIRYYKIEHSGNYTVWADTPDKRSAIYEFDKTPAELENLVGKDMAAKILDNQGKHIDNGQRELSGLDLKVGGEGMKAFYDKIVPTMANKLVKRFGGKVENAEVLADNLSKKDSSIVSGLNLDEGVIYEKVHSLEITPAMRESIQESGLPLFQGKEQSPLGQTQFIGQKPIISLFKNKNRSTLLHELGHVFLQIEHEISQLPNVSEDVKKDWRILEDWLGIQGGKITLEAHEKFARGFEAYLREGRAPSIGLRNAFRRFKSWLTTIYKNVKSLNVEISKPIREVFDRMLATDEQINELRNNPLFRADEKILAMLDEEEKKKYLALVQNADEKTKEKLLAKALKELSREKTKSYKEEKQKVRAAIEEELKKTPIYRAFETLRSEDGFKINAADIENYEGDFINKLPKDIITEDGVAVDMVADFLGFADGGVMLNELANAPNFKSEVNRLTNEAMAERYREEVTEEKVIDESQNDARANKILYELNATNAKVKTFIDTKEAYEQKAKDIIADKQIKDATNSYVFYLAEVKAAREAGVAIGAKDFPKAVEWKKKQLLNHYLYRESLKVKEEVEDLRKRSIRYNKKPVVGKVWIEEDYRERIVGLLEDFNLVENTIGHQKTNISELETWKKEQAQEGVLGLVDFSEIAAFQNENNIRNLKTAEFRTLDDAISNLAHVGQGLRTLEVDGKRIEIEQIADDIVELVNKNIKKDKPSLEDPTTTEKLKRDFDSYTSSLIKTSQTTLKIDGEENLGKFYNYFEKDVNNSELKKEEMKNKAYEKFDEIYKEHFGGYKITNKRTHFEQVGKSYSKPAVLGFALNWGNEINKRRVRDGFGYSNEQVTSILSSLTKNELEFVQDVWNMVNAYWPQVEATQKRLFGFAPKKQRATPFTIKSSDGHLVKMKGGYYPIAFSKEASLVSDTKEDLMEFFAGSAADKISFHASYTKERSEEKISKKIDLTLNPLTRHISQVITDIAMKEAVWNSYKIINNRKLSSALIKKIGLADYKQLQTWLYDMYGRTLVQEGHLGKLASLSRAIATTYAMGFKAATALIQVTGILNSTVKLGYRNMGNGLWKALGNGNPVSINKAAKLAFAKSKILTDRSKTINRDIYEVMDRLQRSGKFTKAVAKFAFFATTKAQMLVDIPTWYGGYYKGLKDFNGDDAKAVELADRLLIETQGSSYKQSRSAVERNEAAIVKAFTVFYSYMNVKLNLLAGSYRKNNFKKPKDVAAFASDFMLLFFTDALVTEFLREGVSNLLAGRDNDDDDEENKALHYANLIGQSLASSVPGVSQFYSGLSGYSFNPGGFKGFEIFGKGVKNLGTEAVKAVSEDEDANLLKTLRALNDTLSIFTVGGGGQIDIFLKAQQEAEKGEDVALIDYILKPPK